MKAGNVGLINLLVAQWEVRFNYVLNQEKVQLCKFSAMIYIAQGEEVYGKHEGSLNSSLTRHPSGNLSVLGQSSLPAGSDGAHGTAFHCRAQLKPTHLSYHGWRHLWDCFTVLPLHSNLTHWLGKGCEDGSVAEQSPNAAFHEQCFHSRGIALQLLLKVCISLASCYCHNCCRP